MTEKVRLDDNRYVLLSDDPEEARALLAKGEAVAGILQEDERDWSGVRYLTTGEDVPEEEWLEMVHARCRQLPVEIARTERLPIREAVPEDAAALVELYKDEDFRLNLEPIRETAEEEAESIRAYIRYVYGFYGYGMWVVTDLSGRIIGRVGLECNAGEEGLELGYAIAKERRGRGLAEEACRAVLNYARERLDEDRIYARIRPDNEASMKLASKLGIRIVEI